MQRRKWFHLLADNYIQNKQNCRPSLQIAIDIGKIIGETSKKDDDLVTDKRDSFLVSGGRHMYQEVSYLIDHDTRVLKIKLKFLVYQNINSGREEGLFL